MVREKKSLKHPPFNPFHGSLYCRKDFQSYEAYKQHMKTAHSVNTDIDIKTEAEERPSGGEPDCSRVSQYEDGSDGKMSKLLSDDGRLEQSDAR